MLTLTHRRARVLFAVTAAVVPFEFRMLGRDLGWGLTAPYGLYLYVNREIQGVTHEFRTPVEELGLLGKYGSGGRIGVIGWVVASALVLVTAVLVLAVERERDWTARRLAAAAAGFGGAGLLFIATRLPMYRGLFVGSPSDPNWFTVPFGAVYLLLGAAVFAYWAREHSREMADGG